VGDAMAGMSAAEVAECFRACYSVAKTEAHLRLEQLVFGSDFGADGWTTLDQADQLARYLELRAGQRLLDIGTGRGWPGLYLVVRTGCDAVLADRPVEGLRQAVSRAYREGVSERVRVVAAAAEALPIRPGSVDAVVHTDVLCCLRPKARVLRACRRVLKPGGRTAFFVIHVNPDLSPEERRRAIDVGPPAVDTRGHDYESLLHSAGFGHVDRIDVTPTYLATIRAWLDHARALADELTPTEPPGAFTERVTERLATRAAIEDGLLLRSLFVARA
jgi:cyclopropane fatty-acyl-phospholipid synthase-like methyltransferase